MLLSRERRPGTVGGEVIVHPLIWAVKTVSVVVVYCHEYCTVPSRKAIVANYCEVQYFAAAVRVLWSRINVELGLVAASARASVKNSVGMKFRAPAS